MKEIELLKHLVNLEQEKHKLEIRIDFLKDDTKLEESKLSFSEVSEEIKLTEKSLSEVENKSYSSKAKNSMINQLEAYVTEINKVQPDLKLLRNQGLILENYLFSGIMRDLHYFLIGEFLGHRIPASLYYTYSEENSVEIKDLSNFLNEEIQNLRQIQDTNYIKLRSFYEGFRERMIEKFIQP